MTRDQFLAALRDALRGLPDAEVEDIVADHRAHFDEARAAGRAEEQVAAALGDPVRLARELRAEAGLRRWQDRRTPANFFGAIVALCGLAAVDVFILLPFICALAFAAFLAGLVLFVGALVGVALVGSLFFWGRFDSSSSPFAVGLAGVGLIAGGIGWGALLLLGLDAMVTLLGHYARLHYQLLRPAGAAG